MSAQPPTEPRNAYVASDRAFSPAPISPRLSFRGWLFSVWLCKNKGYIKAVLAPCSAILTVGANIDATALRFALGLFGIGLVTIAFKLGWDAFDYFVSEVTPDEPEPGA